MSEQASQNPIRVCLGFPPFHAQAYLTRLEAIEGVEATILPIDPGGDWASQAAEGPYSEPPPWGTSVAAERAAALAECDVFTTLHAPDRLAPVAPPGPPRTPSSGKMRWQCACILVPARE